MRVTQMYASSRYGVLLAILSALTVQVSVTKPAHAQNKQQVVSECLKLVATNEIGKAAEIADEIAMWRYLFSPRLIKDSEECLNKSTGEFWKYFSTDGGFLSGHAAREEQAFIEGADERRAQKRRERDERECRVLAEETRIAELQFELQRVRAKRQLESKLETWVVCADKYTLDKEATLLEPVCNALFMTEGLPDSPHAFDYLELQVAQLSLLQAQADLAELSEVGLEPKASTPASKDQCAAILEKP